MTTQSTIGFQKKALRNRISQRLGAVTMGKIKGVFDGLTKVPFQILGS